MCSGTDCATANHWERWRLSCIELTINLLLTRLTDPVILIQIFAFRYRSGVITPGGKPCRAHTVEGVLRVIGEPIASVGAHGPRLNLSNTIDFRLKRMLAAYKREDPPPRRMKPIPISIICHIIGIATAAGRPSTSAIAEMVVLVFFFLLWSGGYTSGSSDSTPFILTDVQLFIGNLRLDIITAPFAMLHRATFCTLEFTTQKNGVRGGIIDLDGSGSTTLCPVHVIACRIIHLRTHRAPLATTLSHYHQNGEWSFS